MTSSSASSDPAISVPAQVPSRSTYGDFCEREVEDASLKKRDIGAWRAGQRKRYLSKYPQRTQGQQIGLNEVLRFGLKIMPNASAIRN
jgi:hypothetical protein